jgi:cytochrome P450
LLTDDGAAPIQRGCVGKNLALMEIRLFLARTVQRYDFEFAPGYGPNSFEPSIKYFFSMQKGPVDLVVQLRK